jgi:hypothetical protein
VSALPWPAGRQVSSPIGIPLLAARGHKLPPYRARKRPAHVAGNHLIRRELHACSLPGDMRSDLLRWCPMAPSGCRPYASSYGQIQASLPLIGRRYDGRNTVKIRLTPKQRPLPYQIISGWRATSGPGRAPAEQNTAACLRCFDV